MVTLKILALHGSQQTAEIFRTRLGRIPIKAKGIAEFVFVDGPIVLERKEGDDVPLRSWYRYQDGKLNLDSVEQCLVYLEQKWVELGPFQGIFGFSMGGAVAATIAANPLRFPNLNFVIIAGAPDVPFLFPAEKGGNPIPTGIHSLHIMGKSDLVVPLASSKQLSRRFPDGRRMIEHEQGHCVPSKAGFLNEVVGFITLMRDNYKENPNPPNQVRSMKETQLFDVEEEGKFKLPAPPIVDKGSDEEVLIRCFSDLDAEVMREELEVLESIFTPEELTVLTPTPKCKNDVTLRCQVRLSLNFNFDDASSTPVPVSWRDNLVLQFTLPSRYPGVDIPKIEVLSENVPWSDFTTAHRDALVAHVSKTAREECVDAANTCLMQCVQAANEWLSDGLWMNFNSGSINDGGPIPRSVPRPEEVADAEEEERVKSATDEACKIAAALQSSDSARLEELRSALINKTENSTDVSKKKTNVNVSLEMSGIAGADDVTVSASARGLWNYTVGLVGKPSAGKSTFYNAVTRALAAGERLRSQGRHAAQVAAHPFTTIEPNIGPGWYVSPHDDFSEESYGKIENKVDKNSGLKINNSGWKGDRVSLHGRFRVKHLENCTGLDAAEINKKLENEDNTGTWRLLPVIVKDVAGLVPGAYKGRGKGNKFLSDLCDADVLVHVVDVTGRSDRDGNVVIAEGDISTDKKSKNKCPGSTPTEDAAWIREELHRWIYGNIRAKWQSVGRKGSDKCAPRVLALFSGYKGPAWCVQLAANRAHLSIDHAISWSDLDIHRLVAHYLFVRFPICLALNKIDSLIPLDTTIEAVTSAREKVRQYQREALERGEIAAPVSAQAECWLQRTETSLEGSVKLPNKGSTEWQNEENCLRKVIAGWGTTGVLEALSAAIQLKPPVLCYPVSDLDSEAPVGWSAGKSTSGDGGTAGVQVPKLQDCIQLKPGSTVEDLFNAMKHGALPNSVMQGDFVRAEGRAIERNSRRFQLRRDSVIDETNHVIKIQSNKRPVWQQQLANTSEGNKKKKS